MSCGRRRAQEEEEQEEAGGGPLLPMRGSSSASAGQGASREVNTGDGTITIRGTFRTTLRGEMDCSGRLAVCCIPRLLDFERHEAAWLSHKTRILRLSVQIRRFRLCPSGTDDGLRNVGRIRPRKSRLAQGNQARHLCCWRVVFVLQVKQAGGKPEARDLDSQGWI